jgi:hypothetical protein
LTSPISNELSREKGICEWLSRQHAATFRGPDRENGANLTPTLIHEYGHALLHFDVDNTEWSKREVEAEAVASVFRRGLRARHRRLGVLRSRSSEKRQISGKYSFLSAVPPLNTRDSPSGLDVLSYSTHEFT